MTQPTMADVILPKSDQWNADDFIAGPRTFTIREVQIRGGQEQPVNILLEGSDKAYRPCKSMSRVLVQAWGPDAKVYIGRSLTLYRDPSVKWGGMEVGGIRISHMSHVEGKMVMQLTATKGQRKPHVVMPLVAEVREIKPETDPAAKYAAAYNASVEVREIKPETDPAAKYAAAYIASVEGTADTAALDAFVNSKAAKIEELREKRPELHTDCLAAVVRRRGQLEADAWAEDEAGEAGK